MRNNQLVEEGFLLREEDHAKFIEAFSSAQDKYYDLVKEANSKGVKHQNKEIRTFLSATTYELNENSIIEVNSNISVNFSFIARTLNDSTKFYLSVSARNVHLIFSDLYEINSFIDAISVEKANNFFSKTQPQIIFEK